MIFSQKIELKMTFPYYWKKSDIHPRTYGISSERKIKEDQRVYSVKYA